MGRPILRTCKNPDCNNQVYGNSTLTTECNKCLLAKSHYATSYRQRYGNKYGAKSTVHNGHRYDSKFEAGVAEGLDLQISAKEILGYDRQYVVELPIYRVDGTIAFKRKWRVDFRVHELDGSYTLLEAKGLELADYKWKRDLLINVWLPEHPDHEFEVVKQYIRKRK